VYSLTQPHFAQGKYILTRKCTQQRWILHGHIPKDKMFQPSVVLISMTEEGAEVAGINGCVRQTFSYVETTEPLTCYRHKSAEISNSF
jgi:hypothetical protein